MIDRRVYVICDLCQASLRDGRGDSLHAEAKATARGWRIVQLHYTGLCAHFCPACAAGKTEAELTGAMMEDWA